jgi:hypothetical protein
MHIEPSSAVGVGVADLPPNAEDDPSSEIIFLLADAV